MITPTQTQQIADWHLPNKSSFVAYLDDNQQLKFNMLIPQINVTSRLPVPARPADVVAIDPSQIVSTLIRDDMHLNYHSENDVATLRRRFQGYSVHIVETSPLKIHFEHCTTLSIFNKSGWKLTTISCHSSDSIGNIKSMITDKLQFPPNTQRLVANGERLEEARTLRDYNLCSKCIVELSISPVCRPHSPEDGNCNLL